MLYKFYCRDSFSHIYKNKDKFISFFCPNFDNGFANIHTFSSHFSPSVHCKQLYVIFFIMTVTLFLHTHIPLRNHKHITPCWTKIYPKLDHLITICTCMHCLCVLSHPHSLPEKLKTPEIYVMHFFTESCKISHI